MKKLKILGIAIIALSMCVLLGITVWAGGTDSVVYSANLDNATVCGDIAQTVTLTVGIDKPTYEVGSIQFDVELPDGWTVNSVTNDGVGTGENVNVTFKSGETLKPNRYSWYSDEANTANISYVAKIDVTIPAGTTAGSYTITVSGIEITDKDFDVVIATSTTVTATVTVEHNFGETTAYKAATCLAVGNEAYKQCTICNKYFAADADKNSTEGKNDTTSFVIAQLGHSYTGAIKSDGNGKDATHSFKCVNGCNEYCGAVPHTWNAGVVNPDSDCTSTGTKTFTCTAEGCGATYTEDVAAKGHTFGTTVEANPATCSATGNEAYKQCTVCNKYFAENAAVNSTEGKDDTTSFVISIDVDAHAYPASPSSYTNNGDTHTACYVCAHNSEHKKYDEPVAHTYNQENDTKCVCGAVELTVIYKGAALANAYEVSGREVKVTFDKACKLGYLDATSGKYVAIAAEHVEGNTYKFTVPDGVTEVLLVVKGDVDGNGEIAVLDRVMVSRALLDVGAAGYLELNDWQKFTADVDENKEIAVLDRVTVSRALLVPGANGYLEFNW